MITVSLDVWKTEQAVLVIPAPAPTRSSFTIYSDELVTKLASNRREKPGGR
jgi:hypothetical protein